MMMLSRFPCAYGLNAGSLDKAINISISVCDTESDPHWNWLGLACETKFILIITVHRFHGLNHSYLTFV